MVENNKNLTLWRLGGLAIFTKKQQFSIALRTP